ncbi:TPA: ATP-binding protein, partial [Listeria monocytogenes]
MNEKQNEIPFDFSYYALDLLGKGLYKNRWSAISELIANGIDARATKISLYMNLIDKEKAVIEIFDNGTGMDYDDLVSKYVHIGRNKRDEELDDVERNALMGRKGIGKLAALNLSQKYYLISKTRNESSLWCLDATEVNKSDTPKLKRVESKSVALESIEHWKENSTGTMIKLTNVDMTGFGIQSMEGLKLKLSDFYLLNQMSCEIEVAYITTKEEKNNIKFKKVEKKVAFKNFYGFFENMENDKYKASLADTVRFPSVYETITEKPRKVLYFDKQNFPEIKGKRRFKNKNGTLSEKEYEFELKGWIGIHTSTKKDDAERNDITFFRNNTYTPNKLRLYIRDKLIVEDFMAQYIRSTQATSGYIEGEISFDILDVNDLEDITTSDRQGFTHEDDRVKLLIDILKPIVNLLIRERNKMGGQIRKEEEEYREQEREEIRKQKDVEAIKRKEAEDQKEAAEKAKAKVNQENMILKNRITQKDIHLGSEKKRNIFLKSSLSEDKKSFSQKAHMIRINVKTIENTTSFLVNEITKEKPKFNIIKEKLKIISHNTNRIK